MNDEPGPSAIAHSMSRRTFLGAATTGAAALFAGAYTSGWWDDLLGTARRYPRYDAEAVAGWSKYRGNPVLGGSLGTCFDVCALSDRGRFRLWFSWRSHGDIGLVESKDGVHWSLPVLSLEPSSASGWETSVNRPVVLRRAHGYRMWYTGQTNDRSAIGLATSADGVHWKRPQAHPVLVPDRPWEKGAVMCPHVLWDAREQVYKMWYSAGDQYEPDAIGYAVSPDGTRWIKHPSNPIFRPGPSGSWDGNKVTACQVVQQGRWYVMFYIGFYNGNAAQIGLARSRDGITDWHRHPANPVIRPALASGRWDYDAVYKPFALSTRRGWMLWYNGRRGDREQIGLALHPGHDLGFTSST